MKIDKNCSDVVVFRRSVYQTGSSVLQSLEYNDKMYGNAAQQAVAIVKA